MNTVKRLAAAILVFVTVFASISLTSSAQLNEAFGGLGAYRSLASSSSLSGMKLPASSGRFIVKRYIGEALGVTQDDVVEWLSSHENDDYYLGTPYVGYPIGSPNGDISFTLNSKYTLGGKVGMNCAGFVSHVLCKCGFDLDSWLEYMAREFPHRWGEQEYDAGSANMWYLYVTGDEQGRRLVDKTTGKSAVTPGENGSDVFVCYAFNDTTEALRSGILRKGDILIYWPTEGFDHSYSGPIDSHIGFFWGDTPRSNRFWHSAGSLATGNAITTMQAMTKYNYVLYVIPISPREEPADDTSK